MEKVKDIKLKKDVFDIEPNDKVLFDALILAKASLRQGTYKVKNRSEVSGGGKKPWRQKGTGRARQGSIRSPQWRGGGVALGPVPRDYSMKMNKKTRKLALKSALSYKNRTDELVIVDSMNLETPKTNEFMNILKNFNFQDKKTLIVVDELTENLVLATRNIPNVLLLDSSEINVLDIVNSDIMLATQGAISEIEEALS